jgi:uncharacterized ion transporter superfamily protein YfcC
MSNILGTLSAARRNVLLVQQVIIHQSDSLLILKHIVCPSDKISLNWTVSPFPVGVAVEIAEIDTLRLAYFSQTSNR